MFINKIFFSVVLFTVAVFSVFKIYKINPYFFSKAELLKTHVTSTPIIFPAQHFNKALPLICGLIDSPPTMFRTNQSRNARVSVPSLKFDLKLKWLTVHKINSTNHNAPKASVVSDGRSLFVGTDDSWLKSFNFEGQQLWGFKAIKINFGIHSTSAADHTGLYMTAQNGSIYKINRDTGRLIWIIKTAGNIDASVLVVDDYIVVAVETSNLTGYLMKIDRMTGELIWTSKSVLGQPQSSPSFDANSGLLYVGTNKGNFYGLDFKTGKVVWKRKTNGAIKSTPVVFKDSVYVSNWNGQLIKFNKQTGKARWKSDLDNKSQVTPVILQNKNLVFVADASGAAFAFDIKTGSEKWKIPFRFKNQISSPVVLYKSEQEKILFYCEKETLCLISAEGKVEKKWPLGYHFTGALTVENEHIPLAFNNGPLALYQFKWE